LGLEILDRGVVAARLWRRGEFGVPGPQRGVANADRLAGSFERIPFVDYQPHGVSFKLIAVGASLRFRLFVHVSDLLWEPLDRLPPLSESRGLSQVRRFDFACSS